jgi:cytochrome c-type biogenesis protein CcmF
LHPPLLYLGYVLTSIPFAYAIAALVLGETSDRWLTETRKAALASWALLGVGIVAGAWWSYAVLGWGGYWAWDPVENAAIMPWLTATAYLHSVMVEEKRRLLRTWNIALVIATFALTILGTFLTRSGVVNSVHSFTQSAIGPLLLGYFVAILVLGVGLLLYRLNDLTDRGSIGAPLSREAIFLFQNVLFIAAMLTVLLGTLYPLIAEAVSGAQLSIGAPYFDRVEVPIGLALLFLMGLGPQLPWHGASRATLERQFTAPVIAAAGGAIVAVLAGMTGVAPVLTYALAAFVTATVVQEFTRGVRARRTLHLEPLMAAFLALFRRNGRRYGGYVVHAAIVLLAIGIAGSNAYQTVREQRLAVGQSMQVGAYTLVYQGSERKTTPQGFEVRGNVDVYKGGRFVERLRPGKNHYVREQQDSTEMAIRSDMLTGEDLDLVPDYDRSGNFYLKALVKPLVNLIWIAGVVFFAGSLIALWPDAREQRRLAERYAPGRALVEA